MHFQSVRLIGYKVSVCHTLHEEAYEVADQKRPCCMYLEGVVIENVECIKYLGVTVTDNL